MMEDLLNVHRREAERVFARSTSWAVGVTDSYDPKTHSVKVKLQPEGTLTGWLPISSLGVGSGYGIHVAPKSGDPVLIHFHEGDREAGVVLGSFFTDKPPPVEIQEGEFLFQDQKNNLIYFKNDGTLTFKHHTGTEIIFNEDSSAVFQHSSGSKFKFAADGTPSADPGGKILFLGGDGSTGIYE